MALKRKTEDVLAFVAVERQSDAAVSTEERAGHRMNGTSDRGGQLDDPPLPLSLVAEGSAGKESAFD
jgi:hypothetical protein